MRTQQTTYLVILFTDDSDGDILVGGESEPMAQTAKPQTVCYEDIDLFLFSNRQHQGTYERPLGWEDRGFRIKGDSKVKGKRSPNRVDSLPKNPIA